MRLALVPLLAAPLLLVPTGAAHASALTCQGQPATIQAGGGVVTGTEGPDVIVATRAGTINALGGDDLICAAGGELDAGAGDDTVVVGDTVGTNTQSARLGPGSNSYTSTGRTLDSVVSGNASAANTDTVDTGPDGDGVTVTLPAGSAPTISAGSVGEGFDRLMVVAAPGDAAAWGAQLATSTALTRAGTTTGTFSQFRYFSFDLGAASSLVLRGTAGPDLVQGIGADTVDVDLGGGDDYLAMFDSVTVPSGGTIDLGSGKDRMSVGSRTAIDVDLREGRLGSVGLAGVETTVMAAPVVHYRGSTGADTALAMGCRVTMRGGPGADVLRRATEDEEPYHPVCRNHRFDVRGQGGRDELGGYKNRDRLIGGPGRDTADGRQGVDVCRAEVTQMCER